MSNKFKVTYYVDDGYVNPGPKHFYVYFSDIEEDMDESDIEDLLDDLVKEDFLQNVSPYVKDEDRMKFVLWSKDSISE